LDAVIVRRLMKTKRQTILPYRIEVTAANDGLTSHAGLPLVAETMRAMGLDQATSDLLNLRKRNSGLTDYQKFESIVVLMAAGGDCYDDMAVLRSDAGLQRLLGYSLPSPDSVRAFINAFHCAWAPTSPCSWTSPDSVQQAGLRAARFESRSLRRRDRCGSAPAIAGT
jgi:hypothetical protein